MKVLSLFTGGGLGDYGLEKAGFEIAGQCEIEEYCQKILALRWPDVPKWRDVREVKGSEVLEKLGRIDLVSGGFPCQDISTAGKGAGITGKRSGLWKEMHRIICEVRPRFVLVENVTALLHRGLGTVLGDLAQIGYDAEWDCIPASAIGAPHQRDRIWIVAWNSYSGDEQKIRKIQEGKDSKSSGVCEDVPYTAGVGSHNQKNKQVLGGKRRSKFLPLESGNSKNVADAGCQHEQRNTKRLEAKKKKWSASILSVKPSRERFGRHWTVEPNVGRVAHGVAKRVDRLKMLGNGQVVQVVELIGNCIREHASVNNI